MRDAQNEKAREMRAPARRFRDQAEMTELPCHRNKLIETALHPVEAADALEVEFKKEHERVCLRVNEA